MRKNNLPAPPPLPLTRPIFSSLLEFQHGAFADKSIRAPDESKTPALQATMLFPFKLTFHIWSLRSTISLFKEN